MIIMDREAKDRCSNCDKYLVSAEERHIMMCNSCLDFLAKLTVGTEFELLLTCHVCGQVRNLEHFGKVTSVEDCICDFCNNGVGHGL